MWSMIQGEDDARGKSSVELILIRGEMQDKETSKDTEREVIHRPSLQRAWTSCPAVRKKKSGEVVSPTQKILYSPAFWSHLSSLKISKRLNQSFWWPSKFKVYSHTIHNYRFCYTDGWSVFRSVLHRSLKSIPLHLGPHFFFCLGERNVSPLLLLFPRDSLNDVAMSPDDDIYLTIITYSQLYHKKTTKKVIA